MLEAFLSFDVFMFPKPMDHCEHSYDRRPQPPTGGHLWSRQLCCCPYILRLDRPPRLQVSLYRIFNVFNRLAIMCQGQGQTDPTIHPSELED